MNVLLIYLSGWFLLSILYYLFEKYLNRSMDSKKLIIYKSIKFGLFSWFGIICSIALIFAWLISELDDYIERKLK